MTRLYGKGTLEVIEKGKKYRIYFSCGKDPVTGKYLRKTETFLGTKRQAELRIEEIRRELEAGKAHNADKITFSDWCERYLSNREKLESRRPKTLKQDRITSRHLLRRLGDTHIVDITPAMITDMYVSMRSDGVGDTTLVQCHRLLNRVLKDAVNNDVIMRNPLDRVEKPKTPKPNRQALSIAESRRLAGICTNGKPTANKTAVFLGLSLGARLGEVLGLTWECIELEERPHVYIYQQLAENGELAPLKTDKDDKPTPRIVPIDASTVAVLKAWKDSQAAQLSALGAKQDKQTPVITNTLGDYVDHHNFERWWRSFSVKNGFGRWVTEDGKEFITLTIGADPEQYRDYVIEWKDASGWACDASGKRYSRSYKRPKVKRHYDGLKYHELRHTHFTMRLAEGMDIPTAKALGGWSTAAMLMNVYAHPVPENIWASAGFMDGLTG